jgi:TolB-like protein/Tfp pilus assembly protein PilF
MSSIVPGYNYDIFISYRQKDNKFDGWVTEFVNNLKNELETTFKEEISVYFDINPHDGLLETHDVDESLKEKLKCLVFIPIISRTYCDPRSFAWEHEFMAFVESASNDQLGLKVKLAGGNVSNRVLPVRIHDLDPIDIELCESVLGGVLRGIEFIYKEPGVNRPLNPEDEVKTNQNKTRYRNQINKISLAIKEIIASVRNPNQKSQGVSEKGNKSVMVFESIEEFEKSIAVLPFINDSPDEENIYFINGLMEEVLNNLQRIKDLRVISRTSVERYRNQNKSITEIAEELGVNYIVEGSGQKYGNAFRLRTQLIMAVKENHLWGESYQQEMTDAKDIFRIQSQIAETIAAELGAAITANEKHLIEKPHTKDLYAYDAYLKGKFYWRKLTKNDLETAMQYFELAKEKDPHYALAYAGIADVWSGLQQMGFVPPSEAGPKAMGAAIKALELDNTRAEVHYTLALMKTWGMWDWESGESAFKNAIRLNPNYAEAHAYYSHFLNIVGRPDEAMKHIELALILDPYNSLLISLYSIDLVFVHRYDDAIIAARKALKNDPSSKVALIALEHSLYHTGRYEDALDPWKSLYYNTSKEVEQAFDQGYAESGYVGALNQAADALVLQLNTNFINPFWIAQSYLMTGNKEKAMECLEKAYEVHDSNLPYLLLPICDSLREEPRFQDLAKKIKLPYK